MKSVDDGYELLKGSNVISKGAACCDKAQYEIFYKISDLKDIVHTALAKSFYKAIDRGVTAKGVINVTSENLEIVERLGRSKLLERRHNGGVYSWLLIVDKKEAIFGVAPTPLADEDFLYTQSQKWIDHLTKTFELIFESSTPLKERIKELNPLKQHV